MKEFFSQLATILIFSGILQGCYLALLLNSKRVRKSRANLFLSILLIAMSFSIAHIVFAAKVIGHISDHVYSLGDPSFLLIAPLLWFYAKELTGDRVKFTWKLLGHFIPFLLIVVCSLTFNSIRSEVFSDFIIEHHRFIGILFWILVVTQFSLYFYFLHRQTSDYRALVQQELSFTEGLYISWVRFFMVVFFLINLFFLFSLFAVIHLEQRYWHPQATALIFSISVFALGYKGMLQREVFFPVETTGEEIRQTKSSPEKPDQELIAKVNAFMEEKRPYLDSELTLTDLAQALGITRSQLSYLINSGMGHNFYDFVNKYRVQEVKRLMEDPKVRHYSMMGLALDAGFKSKSTFNLIFKRFTGLTPSEYQKNILNK